MEQDADPRTAGMRVEARIFLGIATFLVVATAVYFTTSSEDAGSTMLLLAGGMALIVGGYLALQARKATDAAEPGREGGGGADEPALEEAYLPHASVWPFALGMGLVVLANGLALGLWAVIPGGLLAAASAWGYARQSRRRD
jgi:ABC-type Fe3+ transport system permease subunit